MEVVIIDYGAGNIQSLQFALQRQGVSTVLSNKYDVLKKADKIIFPGVGAAAHAMKMLKKHHLDLCIPNLKQDVLGICLGMQLLCESSEEGQTRGFGVFNTSVIKFSENVKVPHMGWNSIEQLNSPLFKGINEGDFMYAVHSYYAPLCDNTIATSDYDGLFSAALQKDNYYGVQFHPEKSSNAGQKLIENFLNL
jgi:glutamine amidotransferase